MRLLPLWIGLACALAPPTASAQSTARQFGEWTLLCRGSLGPKICIIAQSVEDEQDPTQWIALNVHFNPNNEPEMRVVGPSTVLGRSFALTVVDERGFVPMNCRQVRCEKVEYEKILVPMHCGDFYCEGKRRLGKMWVNRVAGTQKIYVQYQISMLNGVEFTLKMTGLPEAIEAVTGKKQ